jgi:hypothetical protein
MAKVDVSHAMPAAQGPVWAVMANPSRFPEWLTIHDRFKGDAPTEIQQGTAFTEVCSIMGMTNSIDWTVTGYDAPGSLRISGTGLAGAQISFTMTVQPAADGSLVQIDAEFTGQMVVGAIGAAVERAAMKEVTASLEKLASLVA